jgi:hypothetical protein
MSNTATPTFAATPSQYELTECSSTEENDQYAEQSKPSPDEPSPR